MNGKNKALHNAVCLILEAEDHWLLQQRDNKPGIWTPGKVNHWGGSFEPSDEGQPEKAAIRELREETALEPEATKLHEFLVEDYQTTTEHGEPEVIHSFCYIIRITNDAAVFVHEGSDAVRIPFTVDLDDPALNLSSFTKHLLEVRKAQLYENQA